MKINFSPQVRDDIRLKSLKKHGDILIINGKKYDLKRFAYDEWNEWISNVIYNETEQRCDVLLPIPHGAPYSVRFPAPIYVTADGDIPIPCTKNLESNYTEIVVKYGLIPWLRKETGIYLIGLNGTRKISEIIAAYTLNGTVVLVLPSDKRIYIQTRDYITAKKAEEACCEYIRRII